jgi:hypothetical protein
MGSRPGRGESPLIDGPCSGRPSGRRRRPEAAALRYRYVMTATPSPATQAASIEPFVGSSRNCG